MHHYSLAALITNDLDSLVHRIEALPPHPQHTEALNLVQKAKQAVSMAQLDIHHSEMRARFAAIDAAAD